MKHKIKLKYINNLANMSKRHSHCVFFLYFNVLFWRHLTYFHNLSICIVHFRAATRWKLSRVIVIGRYKNFVYQRYVTLRSNLSTSSIKAFRGGACLWTDDGRSRGSKKCYWCSSILGVLKWQLTTSFRGVINHS